MFLNFYHVLHCASESFFFLFFLYYIVTRCYYCDICFVFFFFGWRYISRNNLVLLLEPCFLCKGWDRRVGDRVEILLNTLGRDTGWEDLN